MVGKFECTSLGFEKGDTRFDGIVCKIRKWDDKDLHDLKIYLSGIDFIKNELLPALDKLNELGSWEYFEILMQNKELKMENEKLVKRELELIKEKKSLSTQLGELKKKISELESTKE